ncbi:unnamed protein product [Arctogadus glacialis]
MNHESVNTSSRCSSALGRRGEAEEVEEETVNKAQGEELVIDIRMGNDTSPQPLGQDPSNDKSQRDNVTAQREITDMAFQGMVVVVVVVSKEGAGKDKLRSAHGLKILDWMVSIETA